MIVLSAILVIIPSLSRRKDSTTMRDRQTGGCLTSRFGLYPSSIFDVPGARLSELSQLLLLLSKGPCCYFKIMFTASVHSSDLGMYHFPKPLYIPNRRIFLFLFQTSQALIITSTLFN